MKVLFIAPVDNYDAKDGGYGNSANGIAEVLTKMKEEEYISRLHIFNTLNHEQSLLDLPEIDFDVSITVINPNSLLQIKSREIIKKINRRVKRKYLNILWETLPLPKKWKFLWISDLFDGFVTSSYFVAYQISKYTKKKVFYYPLYIDISKFESINIEQKKEEDLFSVLYVGQNTERKGLKDVITTYSRAFDDISDTQLIVKCYNLSEVESPAEEIISRTAQANMKGKESPIYLIEHNLTIEQMNELYTSSSVLLFLSRGEGFGYPAVEAMSCGIPVIYTNWSALSETAKAPGNIPISYFLDEAEGMYHHGYEIDSAYAKPSITFSIAALRMLYSKWKENKQKYYEEVMENKYVVKEKYGYITVSECLLHILDDKESFAPDKYFDKELWNKQEVQWKRYIQGEIH